MINVTKTYLPPLEEYEAYLERIWQKAWITNNGECVIELEKRLKEYLKVPYFLLCNNGTIVLQFAIKALKIKDEIITTPFSYVATTSAILWEQCKPVFADIDKATLTIDPESIEKNITEKTTAILATHVYGNPCDVERIDTIAKKYNLKVIYDAAHCFGVQYKKVNICNYGDISTLSFHATKLFHTIEGGGLVTPHEMLAKEIFMMRQFGHVYDDHFILGLNGKVSEMHAAMGLCILPRIENIIEERKQVCEWYDIGLDRKKISRPSIRPDTTYNYAYYPIILSKEEKLIAVIESLKKEQIAARRYFFPSLNTLPYLDKYNVCPVSESISRRVLSLPLYPGLQRNDVRRICNIINRES